MPKTLRKYRYKRPFGPYIMQTTMSQEMIDIIESVYRGATKGKGLVISPKDYSTKYKY